jgi:outer membrane receptor for ferrienterochelin and colicins
MRQVHALLRVGLIGGLLFGPIFLAETEAQEEWSEDDLAAMEELMAILDEETTAATKTRLNSDYVPGMVTVLQGEDLEALGVTTVWEALALVPGIQTYRTAVGEPFVTVRGLPFPFNAGNVKLLVNSISMTRETSAVNPSVLLLPIEQVDRIEVVRSPSSSVYGDFAFLGVINIITQKGETGGFVSVQDGEHLAAGAQFSGARGNATLDANLAGWTSSQGEGSLQNTADESRLSGIAELSLGGTSLSYQIFDRDFEGNTLLRERQQSIDARHHADLPADWYADVDVAMLLTDVDMPRGAFEGDMIRSEIDLGGAMGATDYLFTIGATRAEIDMAELIATERPLDSVVFTDETWEQLSASGQGQFQLLESLTATVGARIDYRIDLEEDSITPRAALVWRSRQQGHSSRQHLLKAQYSAGSRAPTFFELFGLNQSGSHLEFERVATTEASYVYRDLRRTARLTLFDMNGDDMIFPFGNGIDALPGAGRRAGIQQEPPPGGGPPTGGGPPPGGDPPPPPPPAGFMNIATASSRGFELELEQQLTTSLRWGGTLSFADSEDTRSPDGSSQTPGGLARWMWNSHVIASPIRGIVLGGILQHVGDREAGANDIDGYSRLDLSMSLLRLWQGVSLRGGVKNVVDDEIQYVISLPSGPQVNTHVGRSWWIRLGYEL